MFQYAGQLTGGAPIVRRFGIGETMYVGQLAQSGQVGGAGGIVQIADAATEANENDHGLIGVVTGVFDASRTYDATYRGDKSTYTTTQATIKSNYGPGEVDVCYAIPGVTLLKAPICYTTYGTAPTVLTETTGSAGGTTISHTDAITDIADDFCMIYCRTGANRGLYRVVTTPGANQQVVTIPFPNAIAIGDTFVQAGCVLGVGRMDILATANCIDGNDALAHFYDVFYHEVNLEEAGKEYAVLTLHAKTCGVGV